MAMPGPSSEAAAQETLEPTKPDVAGAAASGVLWLTVQKWIIRITGFVTIAVLTRLLVPADFGTVAAAGTVLPFFYLFADLGFTAYIVQAEHTEDRMLSTAVWFSCLAGLCLWLGLWLLAPWMGAVFGTPGVVEVLRVMSVCVVITAAGSVPLALLRRQMRFRVIAMQGAVAALVAQVVAVVLAVRGAGVWALVAQTLVAALLTTAMSWVAVHWRPGLRFDPGELVRMARFGGFVIAVEVIALARAWGEAAVISAILGAGALGLMTIAQRLVQIVQDLSGSAVMPVTNVAFATIRSDGERLRAAYLRALRMVSLLLSLPLTVVAVAAPVLIQLLFGAGWTGSVAATRLLALAGTLTAVAWLDHGLFYGLGKPGAWLVYAAATDAVTLGTTLLLVHRGLTAVALGFLVVAGLATVARGLMVRRVLGIDARSLSMPYITVAAVIVPAGALGSLVLVGTGSWPVWQRCLATTFTVTLVHLAVSRVAARATFMEFVDMARRTLESSFRQGTR